jgi:hypothetical protein
MVIPLFEQPSLLVAESGPRSPQHTRYAQQTLSVYVAAYAGLLASAHRHRKTFCVSVLDVGTPP